MIKNRFKQQGFHILQKLKVVLLEKQEVQRSKVVKEIAQFHVDDFNNKDHLEVLLIQLHVNSEQALDDVQSVAEYLQSLSTTEREYYCEVIKLVNLILVMPATN